MTVHALHQLTAPAGATPVTPPPQLGDAGAARTGLLLMPDEARRIDDKLNDLRDIVTRIDTKLEMAVKSQTDHEARIRALEAWRWTQLGASVAAASTIATLASKLLGQ